MALSISIRLLSSSLHTSFSPSLTTVNNFQTITSDLVRRQECAEHSEELARMKEELDQEINKHDTRIHK